MIKESVNKPPLRRILMKNRHVFVTSEENLGKFKEPVRIQLRDPSVTPNYSKPRIVPYAVRHWLDEKLKEMIRSGLIELSKGSQFNSPVHIVKKKEPGKYRLAVDYKYLNE